MSVLQTKRWLLATLLGVVTLACGPSFLAQTDTRPTPTPTKTPTSLATDTPLPPPAATAVPATTTPAPTSTSQPTDTPVPTATSNPTEEPTPTAVPPTETPPPSPVEPEAAVAETEPVAPPPAPAEAAPAPEAAVEEPELAYRIVHFKVLGEGENNGGIFNKGGMHHIFLTVLDENGNGLDGAVVKDANGSSLQVVTGDKGPGKAEIMMEWEPFKLYIAADPNGPTTSEVSNQMNTAYPHLPDVVGKLGALDNENSVCPTLDIRCTPPFYNVHFSYEITFQRVK